MESKGGRRRGKKKKKTLCSHALGPAQQKNGLQVRQAPPALGPRGRICRQGPHPSVRPDAVRPSVRPDARVRPSGRPPPSVRTPASVRPDARVSGRRFSHDTQPLTGLLPAAYRPLTGLLPAPYRRLWGDSGAPCRPLTGSLSLMIIGPLRAPSRPLTVEQ